MMVLEKLLKVLFLIIEQTCLIKSEGSVMAKKRTALQPKQPNLCSRQVKLNYLPVCQTVGLCL